jgi:N-acetyl-anhydromuramyl-L-alanine amidase AmpD
VQKSAVDGAIVMDKHGKQRAVTKDFLQTYWGRKVSWVYPHEKSGADFFEGMRGEDVLLVQTTLRKIGYQVETTGIYDESTVSAVMKFQEWFGMETHGIVDHRTRALLYQMME